MAVLGCLEMVFFAKVLFHNVAVCWKKIRGSLDVSQFIKLLLFYLAGSQMTPPTATATK